MGFSLSGLLDSGALAAPLFCRSLCVAPDFGWSRRLPGSMPTSPCLSNGLLRDLTWLAGADYPVCAAEGAIFSLYI